MTNRNLFGGDLKDNENPATIAGTVGGVAVASLGGGLGLVALGPVGVVIGALAGAAGGWWAGRELERVIEGLDRADGEFRTAHERSGHSRAFTEVRHAYQLGYLAGRNPRYGDAAFSAIEGELRAAWISAHDENEDPVTWDEIRAMVGGGFEIARRDRLELEQSTNGTAG